MEEIKIVSGFSNFKMEEKYTLFDKIIVNAPDDESLWKIVTTDKNKKRYVVDPNLK